MATVERVPSRQTSLQRMLELEKQYKLERMHGGQQASPAAAPHPASLNTRPPLNARRSGSLTQQPQNFLMLKAAQQSVALPSLTITIPQISGDQKRGSVAERMADKENEVDETVAEPLHKQVKFLAPEDDDLSDQSSICQSPSWEGYGQKKRDKKLEAERKKKEKNQQEREAKSAKKRLTARLSKAPPRTHSTPAMVPIMNAERSMSDPLLVSSQRVRQGPFSKSSTNIEGDLLPARSAEPQASSSRDMQATVELEGFNQSTGGFNPNQERQTMPQDAPSQQTQVLSKDSGKPRPPSQRPHSMAPLVTMAPMVSSASTSKDNRQPRDLHPPSASRTPLMRHVTSSGHSRSNSLLSGASKMFRGRERSQSQQRTAHSNNSQESIQTMSSGVERGRHTIGYVRHYREQNNDPNAIAFVDEQHINRASSQATSSRSTSQQGLSRRPSLTMEAKSTALRLAGIKPGTGSKTHTRSQSSTDYFTFLDQPYSPPPLDLSSPEGSKPLPVTDNNSVHDLHPTEEPQVEAERSGLPNRSFPLVRESAVTGQFVFPTTSMMPVFLSAPASKAPSIASSGSGPSRKSRSFKGAFAALNIHRSSMPPTPSEAPAPKSPTFQFRPRMSTNAYAPSATTQITSVPMALSPPLETLQLPPKAARVLGEFNNATSPTGQPGTSGTAAIKTTTIQAHPGSRVSEGSSSSSAYDDGSPLPSPATTPDTSRPQSSKGVPVVTDLPPQLGSESPGTQDDEKTVREASDSSGSSTRTGTPRIENAASRKPSTMEEDQWSRTALPLDLDFDAQSFVTSLSNLDNMDSIDDELARIRNLAASSRSEILAAYAARARATESKSQEHLPAPRKSPSPSKALSNPSLRMPESAADVGLVFGASNEFIPPPRSQKREQSGSRPSTAPMDAFMEKSNSQQSTRSQPELMSFKELKSREQDGVREQSNETATKERRQTMVPEMPVSPKEENHKPKRQQKKDQLRGAATEEASKTHGGREYPENSEDVIMPTAGPLKRTPTSDSVDTNCSSVYSARSSSFSDRRFTSAPLSPSESPGLAAYPTENPPFQRPTSPTAHTSLPPSGHHSPEMTPEPRSNPAMSTGKPALKSSASAPATTGASSSSRATGNGPVSILKQTSRSQSPPQGGSHRGPVLSALPKHMQVQAGMPSRPPGAVTDQRVAPIAKMFVECCSCKFYHDMPSKLYECMAKPDAVVEDKLLGISGAITTMVKCPWCTHNMSTQCCAGYAAVVYLKERLH